MSYPSKAFAKRIFIFASLLAHGSLGFALPKTNIHNYCGDLFGSTSQLSQASTKSYVSDAIRQHLSGEDFRTLVVEGIAKDIILEGNKPLGTYDIIYDPAVDPYAVTIQTEFGTYPFVAHEDVDFETLEPQKFVPLRVSMKTGEPRLEVASDHAGASPNAKWVIGINPEWLLPNNILRPQTKAIMERSAATNPDLQSLHGRLALLRGVFLSALRADSAAHPNYRVKGTTRFVPNNPQKVALARLAAMAQQSIADDFFLPGMPKRPARWIDKEPASSGKTVIAASATRSIIMNLASPEELKGLNLTNPLFNFGFDDTTIVYISPKISILPDAVTTLKDELAIADASIVHAYDGKGRIEEMNEDTRLIGTSINHFSDNNFKGLRHILAQRKKAKQKIVFIFDEVHHAANKNVWFAGAILFLNKIYEDNLKDIDPNAKVPNVVIHGMSATDWGNGNDPNLGSDAFNFLLDPNYFGFRSLRQGEPARGKITGGFLSNQEVASLQQASTITEQANMSLLQTKRASTMGYTSPFRVVDEFNTWDLQDSVQADIDAHIPDALKRIEDDVERMERKDPDADFDPYRRRAINQARMRHLLGQVDVTTSAGGVKTKTITIDPIVKEEIKKFLLGHKEAHVPDRPIIFASSIAQAEALKVELAAAFGDPGVASVYGKTLVRTYHSASKGEDKHNLAWFNNTKVMRGSRVAYDFSHDHETNKILIVIDAINEGVNLRGANKGILADPMNFESQATARELIQRLNRFGRVSSFKLGSDILDLTGNTYVLHEGFSDLRSLSTPSRSSAPSLVDQTIAQFAEQSLIPASGDVTDSYRLSREQETYSFPDSELSAFMHWAASNTPFEDLNIENMSGLGVEILRLFDGLFQLKQSVDTKYLEAVPDIDSKIGVMIRHRTHKARNDAKSALWACVEVFPELYQQFLLHQGLESHRSHFESDEELLREFHAEVARHRMVTDKLWLKMRKSLSLLDVYRLDSIVLRLSNRALRTPVKRPFTLKPLVSFYEALFAYVEANLNTTDESGHTLAERGLSALQIHNMDEHRNGNNDAEVAIKIQGSVGAYSILHAERGTHVVRARDGGGDLRSGSFEATIEIADSRDALKEGDRSLKDVVRRELRGSDGVIVTSTSPFIRKENLPLMNHFKENETIHMKPETLRETTRELIKGQDIYLRTTVSNFSRESSSE